MTTGHNGRTLLSPSSKEKAQSKQAAHPGPPKSSVDFMAMVLWLSPVTADRSE